MANVKNAFKHSPKEVLDYIGRNLLHTYCMKMHYLVIDIDIHSLDEKLKDFDLDAKPLSYEDFLIGDSNVFQGSKLALYKQRCSDPSYQAYGIIENGRLLYSTWFSTSNLGLPLIKYRIPLLPNEGLLEDSYCDPIARGRGFHGKMNLYRLKKLYELGKTRVIVIVLDGNIPAMKVQLKSGLHELGHFYLGKIFGITFCTLKKSKYENLS